MTLTREKNTLEDIGSPIKQFTAFVAEKVGNLACRKRGDGKKINGLTQARTMS